MMTYEQALAYIHSVLWRGSKRGLSRTQELLQALGSPEKKLKFVHVAGTNGKGSTCACIESILRHAGYRTGLYTSPYIARFNERIQVRGQEIPDDRLAALVERIRPVAESCEDKPTEFEIVTALGFMYFAEQQCDLVVLEVGLGGEFDSTNVIDPPEAAVITAIGLDHTQYLGPTLADVARAKAGIIKPGCDVVAYGGVPEADQVFRETCREKNARLRFVPMEKVCKKQSDLTSNIFDFGRYQDIFLPLAGSYQPYNAATAITAVLTLREKGYNITDEAILRGLAEVRWPGRFELLRRNPVFLLDGAHNPHGAAAAADSLKALFGSRKIVFLSGVMADKDVSRILAPLVPLAACFVTVTPNNTRSLPAEDYARLIAEMGVPSEAAPDIPAGARRAAELAGPGGVVCALGSLYFSEDVRQAVLAL